MALNILEIFEFIIDYGVKNFINLLTRLASLISPILYWYIFSQIIGHKYFGLNLITYSGLIFTAIMFIYFIKIKYNEIYFIEKTVINIEQLHEVFEKPSNHSLTEEFKKECSKFLKPYGYHRPMVRFIYNELQVNPNTLFIMTNLLFDSFNSYSLYSFIYYIFNNNSQYINNVISSLHQYNTISNITHTYLPFLLILMTILHLLRSNVIKYIMNNNNLRLPIILYSFFDEILLDISSNWISAISNILLFPFKYHQNQKTKIFTPFIFPGNIAEVLQTTAIHTGNEPLRVGIINYTDETVEGLESLLSSREDLSLLPKVEYISAFNIELDEIIKEILRSKPTVILGISDSGCEVLGRIMYDTAQGSRKGEFYIRKTDFKIEFVKICEQLELQKRQMRPLPKTLTDMIENEYGGS